MHHFEVHLLLGETHSNLRRLNFMVGLSVVIAETTEFTPQFRRFGVPRYST
jgi:hypothetical protein